VRLLPPRDKAKEGLKPVKITTLIATETNPPPGEKAMEWTLLKGLPIPDLEAALEVIQWYLRCLSRKMSPQLLNFFIN